MDRTFYPTSQRTHVQQVQDSIAALAELSGKRVLLMDEAEVEALQLLSSFDGNGWLCPVIISLPSEAGVNAQEALGACVAALTKLGCDVRPARREEGR